MQIKKRIIRYSLWSALVAFILMNLIAYTHAYRFTHFEESSGSRTKDPSELSSLDKATVVLTGIDNPRPSHKAHPVVPFTTINIGNEEKLEAWKIDIPESKGTILMFHGYAGEKSSLLSRSTEFNKMGYNTVLIDFLGSGGSSGNSTSIGYHEAEEVLAAYQYFLQAGEENIILFGTSMGSAAILKAIHDQQAELTINPSAIIIECPFGSLYQTVSARFNLMNVPAVPMAALLTFWGGVQHGYWAFDHNPSEYAKSVSCPTLLLFGEKDDRVSLDETKEIFSNLNGPKTLCTYGETGHNVFSDSNKLNWIRDVSRFLNERSTDI